jgi:hypothetical protein
MTVHIDGVVNDGHGRTSFVVHPLTVTLYRRVGSANSGRIRCRPRRHGAIRPRSSSVGLLLRGQAVTGRTPGSAA